MASSGTDETREFTPKFNADGLLAAIAVDFASREVLMFAWMNAESLSKTFETGIAHYWSRSRKSLWRKGETSGNEQMIRRIRVDCDQDCLILEVSVRGDGASCHTGRESCFYRRLVATEDGARLEFIET